MVKKLFFKSVLVFSLCIPFAANAGNPLTITNNTKLDSTCIINGTVCSNALGDIGITHPGKTNTIPATTVGLACWGHNDDCVADVYMTNNCTGPKIGTVHLNTSSGIQSASVDDSNYRIDYQKDDFFVILSGGPSIGR